MTDQQHIWESLCESADARGYIAQLTGPELKRLYGHVMQIIARNGGESGVPALVKSLVEADAAARYLSRAELGGTDR
jgi:hypothetical protein